MNKRGFLKWGAALAAANAWPLLLAAGSVHAHTPYRQWDIFRKRYLQVLTSRSDLDGDAIGDDWVALLHDRLPLSRAMVSRARDLNRVASLLKTDQAKLAVLSHADARNMYEARPPFEDFRPMPLQVMLENASHVLVARDDLPLHHGYAIAITLLEEAGSLRLSVPLEGKFGMALHPGARAAALGETIEPPVSS